MILEPTCPLNIRSAVRMLAAIGFNDQSSVETHEIDDVCAKRMLPTELESGELPAAQCIPKPLFRVDRICSEFADEFVWHLSEASTRGEAGTPTLTRFASLTTLSRQAGEGSFAALP